MSNNILIYVIVALNAACQVMLIWRMKLSRWTRWKFSSLAFGAPLLIVIVMRLMVAMGIVHRRMAEQVGIERLVTSLAGILLIAAPLIVTGAAIISRRKKQAIC